jgi:hypothetical protein
VEKMEKPSRCNYVSCDNCNNNRIHNTRNKQYKLCTDGDFKYSEKRPMGRSGGSSKYSKWNH